jgi:hAT family protein
VELNDSRRIAERDELREYLNASPATDDTDTLQWWKTNAGVYPCLATMARDYLAIPATSVPVECIFSGGTDLVPPKCGSLSEDSIQTCLRLKSWLKLPR